MPAPPRVYGRPALALDGRRVALAIEGVAWMYDLARDVLSRLPAPPGGTALFPIFTPDATRVAYQSDDIRGARAIYWAPVDGSGNPEVLVRSENRLRAEDWTGSGDGLMLAYTETRPVTSSDIWLLEMSGERRSRPLIDSPGDQGQAEFSPDGRWLAFSSSESGRAEVFIQPFSGPGARVQVSASGGAEPHWARNGRELFSLDGSTMMVADVPATSAMGVGRARRVFEQGASARGLGLLDYAVASDGRFLMVQRIGPEQPATSQIHVVLNWFEELTRLVPTK